MPEFVTAGPEAAVFKSPEFAAVVLTVVVTKLLTCVELAEKFSPPIVFKLVGK
jgi:hypothetical protein